MSAVVRVKRRIDEEPLSGFVLNCKKRKVGDEIRENLFETKDEVSTVLKFAGTVESQDEHVVEQINRLTKDEAKLLAKKVRKPSNVTERNREEMRENLHENRFKVVNCFRAINDEVANPKEITIVDIEKQNDTDANVTHTKKTNESQPSSSSCVITTPSENFVYDLYVPENQQENETTNYIADNYTINNISVRPFDDLIYEDRYRDNDSDDDTESEDSNCEDYYKNDYPDTDEDEDCLSVGDEDIRKAVEDYDIDADRNLSSDDETNFNNGFVYSVDAEGIGFEDDIDYCDVNRYGEAYARYKAKVLKTKATDCDEHDSNIEDEEYDSD